MNQAIQDQTQESAVAAQGAALALRAERVERLLAELTLAEKVGQMSQLTLPEQLEADAASHARLLAELRAGGIGSCLNARDLELRNELQRVAVEETRLGIPLLFGRDVIHGYRTIFPIPLAVAASFDPSLAEAVAAAAAREAREAGIDWTFAPMVDVTREPRWGRVAESFGEDPWLASRLGAAMVHGFQGNDPSRPDRLAACAKHYLGYGATEAGKEYNTTWVPEPLLRDVYLPPFRACVEAGVLTVMCGFNDLNGVPMSGQRWALRELLEGELGFRGFVVSDWASIEEMIQHGSCAGAREAALEAASAGVHMEMVSRTYRQELVQLVESGALPMAEIDDAVRRILQVKLALGLFERPYTQRPQPSAALCSEHLELARRAARQSLVLLENRGGCLPLSSSLASLCLVGPLADDPHNPLGCWSFDGDRHATVTLLSALRQRLGARVQLSYAPGLPDARSSDRSGFESARAAVAAAQAAIVVLGEDGNISGECRSRAFLGLPGVQTELLELLASTGTPLIVVVMAGRPLTLAREAELASALLYAWHPGTLGGPAIADVLFGDAPPSGKLPISFPRTVGQVPIYHAHKNTGRPPRTGRRGIPSGTPLDPVDMDASYLDVDVSPAYPFGFGLSYTSFRYSELSVSPTRGSFDTRFEVSALLTNTGDRRGVEVAQLYVRDLVGSRTRPVRELKGCQRVELPAGGSERLRFALAASDLAFCRRDLSVGAEPGRFQVFVGGDSTASAGAEFELC
ncbi:MAG TPA: glycoside hydrolase family 3 N-terminal domain-containing protein [Polyangiaceae bacterium]|jgi:beta-glucosidase|nr:glycoside hydrolase family 3 N-terminal domain-containing protein [Polyangiaceae bacterium]